jgi:hypothetical protein
MERKSQSAAPQSPDRVLLVSLANLKDDDEDERSSDETLAEGGTRIRGGRSLS